MCQLTNEPNPTSRLYAPIWFIGTLDNWLIELLWKLNALPQISES